MEYTKWVACWGNATSITDRKECVYAKDITLRYPVRMVFSGSRLRFRFSNLTGTEPVTISKACIGREQQRRSSLTEALAKSYVADAEQDYVSDYEPEYVTVAITFGGQRSVTIEAGKEMESDEIAMDVVSGDMVDISIYLGDYTQMNAGTLITGPLSRGLYAYGDPSTGSGQRFAESRNFPLELRRKTNWFYFLNTISILTEEKNHCIVCYGDSITAQSWPDYLADHLWRDGHRDVAVIRRAVSGTRILRQYDCITYQAYGLKGATRFPIEMNTPGMSDVIIQHGINDIIHPVGTDVNPFRPWSDMPTVQELEDGVEHIYVDYLRTHFPEVKIWSGTLLPILGWRTYNEERDKFRNTFNEWLRAESPEVRGERSEVLSNESQQAEARGEKLFDGCIDFEEAVRDSSDPRAFAPGYDSGDHLHPSEKAYDAMAQAAMAALF